MLSYTQYFLNLTKHKAFGENRPQLGNHFSSHQETRRDLESDKRTGLSNVEFEVEYDTKTDEIYKLDDLTVRSYVKLAQRIAKSPAKKHKKPKKKKKKKTKSKIVEEKSDPIDIKKGDEKVWRTYVQRAFVGTLSDKELNNFTTQRNFCIVEEL